MNQGVDRMGRAPINVHQTQLPPLQIAEGSHVGVDAPWCVRSDAHSCPRNLDGKCPHESTHIGFRRAVNRLERYDRKSVVYGKTVYVMVALGCHRIIKKRQTSSQ